MTSGTSIKQHPEICFSSRLLLTEFLPRGRAGLFISEKLLGTKLITEEKETEDAGHSPGSLSQDTSRQLEPSKGGWDTVPSNKRRRTEEGQENCQLSLLLLDRRGKRVEGRRAATSHSRHYDAVQSPPSVCSLSLHTPGTAGTDESGCWFSM